MLSLPPIARNPSHDEIRRYLPLVERVVSSVRRRLPSHLSRADLVAAGVRGLVDALRRDPGGHERFEAYASIRIRGAIYDDLRSLDWAPRSSRSAEGAVSVVAFEDLAPGEQSRHGHDVEALDAEGLMAMFEEQDALARAIDALPARERLIIRSRYFEGKQLEEIGAELHVTAARISQLHSRAIGMLRVALTK